MVSGGVAASRKREFTKSLCPPWVSAHGLDGGRCNIFVMDIVAVLIGIFMFAVLYALIIGIDKI
jgi:hypothetical protein